MILPSGILNTIRDQLYEAEEGFYSDSEIYTYLSEAESTMADAVGGVRTTSTISTSGSLAEYTRPSGALEIYRVTWDSKTMDKININDVDRVEGDQYGGVGMSGNPQFYYEDGDVVGLSPSPSSTKNLKIWYEYFPTVLASGSTSFSIDDQFVYSLINYVLFRAYSKDNEQVQANVYLQLWNHSIDKAKVSYRQRERRNQRVIVKHNDPYTDWGY